MEREGARSKMLDDIDTWRGELMGVALDAASSQYFGCIFDEKYRPAWLESIIR